MTAAQELFELLKDARPAVPRPSKPAQSPAKVQQPVRALRFTVELPALGGAVELTPHRGFEPVHCKRCGAEREQKRVRLRAGSVIDVRPCGVCK